MGAVVDRIKGLIGLERSVFDTIKSGQDTITSTLSLMSDFSGFKVFPRSVDFLRFQVVSGGPINVGSIAIPTAGGTEGSLQFYAGDFFEVDGPDMARMQFILATGGANAVVNVHALRRLR